MSLVFDMGKCAEKQQIFYILVTNLMH